MQLPLLYTFRCIESASSCRIIVPYPCMYRAAWGLVTHPSLYSLLPHLLLSRSHWQQNYYKLKFWVWCMLAMYTKLCNFTYLWWVFFNMAMGMNFPCGPLEDLPRLNLFTQLYNLSVHQPVDLLQPSSAAVEQAFSASRIWKTCDCTTLSFIQYYAFLALIEILMTIILGIAAHLSTCYKFWTWWLFNYGI